MNIEAFCIEEDRRYFVLTTPWVKDGWRYATDGRIAVREPTTDEDSDPHKRPVELMQTFFGARMRGIHILIPHHDKELAEIVKEPACLADDVKCPSQTSCCFMDESKCLNLVSTRVPTNMEFAGRRWQGKYIELLNDELPGARYALAEYGMRFVCGDVEGVLARMKDGCDDD